jgi:DNA-binding CsgD family transcriptional regulator
LTETEVEVLRALVAGRTPDEIAADQGVAITTVRTHIMRLHQKFGVTRTLDVVRIALANRLTGNGA